MFDIVEYYIKEKKKVEDDLKAANEKLEKDLKPLKEAYKYLHSQLYLLESQLRTPLMFPSEPLFDKSLSTGFRTSLGEIKLWNSQEKPRAMKCNKDDIITYHYDSKYYSDPDKILKDLIQKLVK